jgi:hypothetical protein
MENSIEIMGKVRVMFENSCREAEVAVSGHGTSRFRTLTLLTCDVSGLLLVFVRKGLRLGKDLMWQGLRSIFALFPFFF